MNLTELLPDYLKKKYNSKKIALHYTSYDGDFEIFESDNEYDLAVYCLENQAELWQNGERLVYCDNWCDFVRNILKQLDDQTRKLIKDNKEISKHFPNDV